MIIEHIEHNPTAQQREAAEEITRFLKCKEDSAVFLLTGFAGTGKTTLVAAMCSMDMPIILLAPTGRAAKVMEDYSGRRAYTIHKEIYREKSYEGPNTEFGLNFNRHRRTLFIVDEASMIGAGDNNGSMFGSGNLLEDLIRYIQTGVGCRLMLVGDTAQLPPVGCDESPALSANWLDSYGMRIFSAHLTDVVRQNAGGILTNATELRKLLSQNTTYFRPQIRFSGFADIVNVSGNELIETLQNSYSRCGVDDTIVVTRSNYRAGIYNQGIRRRIFEYEDELSGSDRVVIVKNNYFWTEPAKTIETVDEETGEIKVVEDETNNQLSFLANGEGAVVRRFRNIRNVHGFDFADLTLQFPSYDNEEIDVTAILDTLRSDAPALTREQQDTLFQKVWNDYPEYKRKKERIQAVRRDPYFNALQIKYGYAVTCHKAQGGQWRHVYVDVHPIGDEMLTRDYVRWLYTALTRATEKVFLVNWPSSQTDMLSTAEHTR